MSNYEVKKGPLGNVVQYGCPNCNSPLTSKLQEAGQHDVCPDCGTTFVVPGQAEKEELERYAALQKQAKIEERRRKKLEAEEAKQRIEEQRKAREEAAALARIQAPPPVASPFTSPSMPTTHDERHQTEHQFGDGILERSFTVARGFSVVVIVLFTVLLTLALMGSVVVHLFKRNVEAPPVAVPIKAEFDEEEAANRLSESKDDETATQTKQNYDSFQQVVRMHRLDRWTDSYIEGLLDDLNEFQQREFLNGLRTLLDGKDIDDKDKAAMWYTTEYSVRHSSYERNLALDEANNKFWSRMSFVLIVGSLYLFIGLMAFIAFPLLIRIERNTRHHSAHA